MLFIPPETAQSWKLSENVARTFAGHVRMSCSSSYMNTKGGKVYRTLVDPENVIAYTNSRKEQEVIVFQEMIENIEDIT
ncbi:hypothetical protein AWH48_16570 [Domibacillus aminovorans]|uniref:Uncharacterized protein n=1 Tax=Domibacillus aminovorans TaxID=29332 RepID=A0A177KZR0_9BACI|nr:hypothetical protein [Domibacillus aminovorans]OAH58617.1 hypothetical protein AWH48_16570 [Domibacillus aminovorans]